MFITAVLVGVAGNTIGLLVALELDQPPGPVLVLVSGALTTVSYMKKGFTNVPSFH
jgi:zinc transport system permease protein